MSSGSGRIGKKAKGKAISNPKHLSLQEKKEMADKEEDALLKQIDDLNKWSNTVDGMNDEQLKEYLKCRPEELKSVKIQKSKPKQKVQKVVKNKSSTCSGIMASVWKFHKEDNDKETKASGISLQVAGQNQLQ